MNENELRNEKARLKLRAQISANDANELYNAAIVVRRVFLNKDIGYTEEMKPVFDLVSKELEKLSEKALSEVSRYWNEYNSFGKRR